MNDLSGLVAVVTGGASGIGAATVSALKGAGARVAVLDRDPTPGLEDKPSDDALSLRCDVTVATDVSRAIDAVVARFGRLDIVVNNAGIGAVGDLERSTDLEWASVFDVNVFGAARVARAALPHLRRSPHAVIVNIASVVASVGVRERVVYSASKGAVAAMTLAMAADHLADGVRVNAVSPGTAETPWVTRLLDGALDAQAAESSLKARQPMGRLVTAEEVAHAVAYLVSPCSASTTGTTLSVDGGMLGLRV